MNLSDDDNSHQIVFYDDALHGTSTTVTAKRVTAAKFWIWPDTTATYSMETEATTEYSMFTSEDGYVAFDVYNDYGGYLGKYSGGKTAFKMTSDSFKYETTPWYKIWGTEWTDIDTHESEINGIKVGVIEYIYLSEDTGAEDNNEILKDNLGVITSKGEATTVSGFNIIRMWTSRTPEAVAYLKTTNFA
jgi:hypothetical protein